MTSLRVRIRQVPLLLSACLAVAAEKNAAWDDFSEPLCFESRAELDQALDDYLSGEKERQNDVEFVYGPIRTWCTSSITDFSHVFDGYRHPAFNEPIDGWDLSSAQSVRGMFYRATDFNQDISSWDLSSATDMTGMFALATSFNQDISSWSTHRVTSMRGTFEGATSFRRCDGLLRWDTQNVVDTASMLLDSGCDRQADLLASLGEEAFEESL